jgi:prophage regulatory protein
LREDVHRQIFFGEWMMEAVLQRERFLRLSEVKIRTGLGRSAIYMRVMAGTFPKPIPLSTRKDGRAALIAFAESEIDQWIRRTIAEARGEPRAA